jgi:cytoskeletal protein RodZ
VSIGDSLAAARRQTGLTIAQVSDQTRIRETIIRGIERGDFSACGGDFFARGHIRSIAKVIGIDPAPLIMEYDAAHGPPHAIRAAEAFGPSKPIRLTERRPVNWSVAMIVALAVIVGYLVFHTLSSGSKSPATPVAAERPAAHASHPVTPSGSPGVNPDSATAGQLVIKLVAKSAPCWVEFTTLRGGYVSQVILPAGATKTWIFRRAMNMRLGNPAAVVLTVNGKDRGSPGTAGSPVTLSFRPGQQLSG